MSSYSSVPTHAEDPVNRARQSISLMLKKLAEPDGNDGYGDVMLYGQTDGSDRRGATFFTDSLDVISHALDACEERMRETSEEQDHRFSFCVESVCPACIAEFETGEKGIPYGTVLNEDELQRAAFLVIDRYRDYIDWCCADARSEFVDEAVDAVVGAEELEKRLKRVQSAS